MALSLPAGISVNNSSPLQNQSVGVKISQPGFNARNASPTQLIFDSSWPSVASAFTKYLPSGSPGTVAHNLGYPPFTRIYQVDASGNLVQASTQVNVDKTNVYLTINNAATTANYMIDCSNLDLSADVDYPNLPFVSVNSAYDPNFGIKVTKTNKSTLSKDPRDYVLHSRYRSPLIQAVKTEKTMPSSNLSAGSGIVAYVNTSGKATWNYGWIKMGPAIAANLGVPVGSYHYAPYFSQAYPRTFTDGITTYLQYAFGDLGATLVILRDPFFAPTIKQAFY